jgi:hypothetical protein
MRFFCVERCDLLSKYQNVPLACPKACTNVSQTGNVKIEKSLLILLMRERKGKYNEEMEHCRHQAGVEPVYSLIELNPSLETANCAATQEIPSILCKPKFQYRAHKSPPPLLS